jgi:hypothetical protein
MSRVARTSFLYFLHLRLFPNSDFHWLSADAADVTPAEET